jgi:hypothetical protein
MIVDFWWRRVVGKRVIADGSFAAVDTFQKK